MIKNNKCMKFNVMIKKTRIAIVGLEFGLNLFDIEYFPGKEKADKYFELIACCDMNRVKADAYGLKHGLKVYYDIDTMLCDGDIEVVCLFTGPNGRASLIDKVISSGRDVITTKPFEIDPQAAINVLKKADDLGRLIYLNSPNPVPPLDVAQIIAWRDKYNLGRLIALRFETWCNYRERSDGSWYDDPKKCPVAPVFRLGIYGINDVLRFTSKPVSVQAIETQIFTGRKTSDNALLAVSFEHGEIATFFASFCVADSRAYPDKLVLNFERGTIQKNSDLSADILRSVNMQLVTAVDGHTLTETVNVDRANGSGSYMWKEFYEGFKERKKPQLPPELIPNSIRITQAMYEASTTGKTVRLD